MDYSQLEDSLSIPFKELGNLKKQVALFLNNGKEVITPVDCPKLINHEKENDKTTLSILIT